MGGLMVDLDLCLEGCERVCLCKCAGDDKERKRKVAF